MIYTMIVLAFLGLAAAWQVRPPYDVPEEKDEEAVREARPERPAYAAQPIPCGEDAPTFNAFSRQVFAPFARAQFGLPKNAGNTSSANATKRLRDYLEEQIPVVQEHGWYGKVDIWDEAVQLAQSGYEHPVLDWMQALRVGVGISAKKDTGKALGLLDGLDGKAEGKPNRTFIRLLAAHGRYQVQPNNENKEAYYEAAVEWLKDVLQDPKNSRNALYMLENFITLRREEAFQSYLPQIEPVDRWFFLLVRGRYTFYTSFDEDRKQDWSPAANGDGWGNSASGLKAVRADLEEAWRLRPELPEAATTLMAVSGVDGRDDIRMWFDRAVATECDHPYAYQRYLWYSRPRWGGSVQAMRAFAEECYNTKRFDTWIPYYYVRALLNASTEECGRWQDVFLEDGVYEKCHGVLMAMLEAGRFFKKDLDLFSCLLAMIAWSVGDLDTAIEVNKIRQGSFSDSALSRVGGASYYPITRALDVLGKKQPEELIEFTRHCLRRELDDETAALLLKLEAKGTFNIKDNLPVAMPLIFIFNFNVGYEVGRWTDLQTSPHFDGWVNYNQRFRTWNGIWYVAGAQISRLSLSVPAPENLELECKVILGDGEAGALFAIALDDPSLTDWKVPAIRLSRKAGQVTAGIEGVTNDVRPVAWGDDQEPAVVRVVSMDNRLSLSVNGQTVFADLDATNAFRPSNRDKTRGLQVRGQRSSFSELRVRKPQPQRPGFGE